MKNLVFKKLIYPVIASILLFSTTSLSFASEKNPDVWKIPTDNYSKSIDILQKYENGELCEFNGSFTYPNNLSSAAYTEISDSEHILSDPNTSMTAPVLKENAGLIDKIENTESSGTIDILGEYETKEPASSSEHLTVPDMSYSEIDKILISSSSKVNVSSSVSSEDGHITISLEGEEDGTVLDSVLSSGTKYCNLIALASSEVIIQSMANFFSPSFSTILQLSAGDDSSVGYTYTKNEVSNSAFFKIIFNLGMYLGAFIATAIFFFNIVFLIFGRANTIKNSPVSLAAFYVVALVLILLSFDIVYIIVETMGRLWSDYVWGGITFAGIGINGVSSTEALFGSDLISNVRGGAKKGNIMGVTLDIGNEVVGGIIMSILSIFLIWKLLKNLIRLFMELAERYFILMILSCFFPSAVALIVSTSTRTIFFSYLRMLFSQGFIMIANLAFIKFYIYVGDGWMDSFTTWIAALSYLKVCQKFDNLLMAMGLNVVQTAAPVIRGMGGAFSRAVMSLQGINRMGGNIGGSLMKAGADSNNYNLFKAGNKLSSGIVGFASSSKVPETVMQRQFESHVNNLQVANPGIYNVAGENLPQAMKNAGLPSTSATKLTNAGVDMQKVSSFEILKNGDVSLRSADVPMASIVNGKVNTSSSLNSEQHLASLDATAYKDWSQNGLETFKNARESAGETYDNADLLQAQMDYYQHHGYSELLSKDNVNAPSQEALCAEYGEKDGYHGLQILANANESTPGYASMQCVGTVKAEHNQYKNSSFRLESYNAAQYPELKEKITDSKNFGGEWRAMQSNGNYYYIHKTEESATRPAVRNIRKPLSAKAKVKQSASDKPPVTDKANKSSRTNRKSKS